MHRRKFLAATTALPLALSAATDNEQPMTESRQLIELRTYEIKFLGSGKGVLMKYLNEALAPALKRLGCPTFRIMTELGNSDPANVWVLIAYPDANTYLAGQDLSADKAYQTASADYHAVPVDKPVFNRYTSQLLLAFTGMPEVVFPGPEAGILELRTYEGYSEDATRRKIEMFNVEEIELFHETGLHPVFFGDMISGPYRPSLVYMLHFKDMAERDANWGTFLAHPKWKAMLRMEKYANTVANIRKTFLVPA